MKFSYDYSIEYLTASGEWVDNGQYYKTYQDAKNALKHEPKNEKYRIVENTYITRVEKRYCQ